MPGSLLASAWLELGGVPQVFLLYPEARPVNQLFLVFMLGGMMLGGASILAARPEAYLAFIVPAGLAPAARLMLQGDEVHLTFSKGGAPVRRLASLAQLIMDAIP